MELLFFGLIVTVTGLLLWWQWAMRRRARRLVGRAAPDTRAVDRHCTARHRIYFFHAPRCGPCRAAAPVVDKLSRQYSNLISVDVTAHPRLAYEFGIAVTPSFVVVTNDRISELRLGAAGESWLRARLERGAESMA
ncbi:thioredoxin family protein [Thiohalophilus thiocyanatoxydans]|uniref:Thioredoxin n=1 Tax=Thiohalophilus thiocyanatoxydans TaxID=381308 RepID=A0A4R8ISB0_9GAMM|nr:thioredoxin family protein [Thiohalophilus thiocyanatoxydans]TDY03922.1 thioredoxin [Thiohalophilus thiocyanatoxydans]